MRRWLFVDGVDGREVSGVGIGVASVEVDSYKFFERAKLTCQYRASSAPVEYYGHLADAGTGGGGMSSALSLFASLEGGVISISGLRSDPVS